MDNVSVLDFFYQNGHKYELRRFKEFGVALFVDDEEMDLHDVAELRGMKMFYPNISVGKFWRIIRGDENVTSEHNHQLLDDYFGSLEQFIDGVISARQADPEYSPDISQEYNDHYKAVIALLNGWEK